MITKRCGWLTQNLTFPSNGGIEFDHKGSKYSKFSVTPAGILNTQTSESVFHPSPFGEVKNAKDSESRHLTVLWQNPLTPTANKGIENMNARLESYLHDHKELEQRHDAEIKALKHAYQDLSDKCSRTDEELKAIRKIVNQGGTDSSFQSLHRRLLIGSTDASYQSPITGVAFYARLMKAYNSLGERETVIFDDVVTNIGNGYDVNNGIFFCPINGVYIFAATVASADNNKNLDAEIVHQGKAVARLHSTLYGFDMGSQVAMLHCQQGEKVRIRHMESAGDTKTMPAGFSGFSGALLHSM